MTEIVATSIGNAGAAPANNNAATETTKKKIRRGISNETRTVSRLKFDESVANRTNGLFQAVIDTVEVRSAKIGEDAAGMASFAGLEIPTFVVNFHSLHDTPEKWRWVTLRLMAVESNVGTIPFGEEEWKVSNVLGYIKHLLDVLYLKGRDLTEEEENALELPFTDYEEDENGNIVYNPIDAEEVVAGYRTLFTNAAAMLNGTWGLAEGANPKPCYVNPDGKKAWLWIKLLRFTKNRGKWQPVVRGGNNTGDLGFPNFLGTGVIERYVKESAPALRVDFTKESIIPQKYEEKGIAPNLPNSMQGGIPIGGVTPTFDSGMAQPDYGQFNDMPFGGDAPF